MGFSSGFGSGLVAGFDGALAVASGAGFDSDLTSGLGAAGLGSAFGSALGSVFTSGLGAGALGSILGAGLVSSLTSGFGAAGLGSAFGIALVSVLSSGLGAAALDSTFGAAFGSGLGTGLVATVPGSDLGSDFGSAFGAVLVVVDAVDLGVVVLGSALDLSSVRGVVSALGATVEGAFWAVLDSGVAVVLGAVLVVAFAVDLGVVVRGSALDLSSVRGAVSDLGATVEGAFGAVLASEDVVLLGAVLVAGVDPIRGVEADLVVVLDAVIGLATARVVGRPPLALANDALSALAAGMCCV